MSKRRHLMIDLETMGVSSRAAIVAIGAVIFDPLDEPLPEPNSVEAIESYFYCNVSLASSLKAGLEVDGSTVAWWLQQDEDARRRLFDPEPGTLKEALSRLQLFAKGCEVAWSHGATFDLVILNEAYRAIGSRAPWDFWNCRDTRTIYDLAYPAEEVPSVPASRKHDALWDAWRQSIAVQQRYRKLGLVAGVPA